MALPVSKDELSEMRYAFEFFDKARVGTINVRQFAQGVRGMGMELTEAELYNIMQSNDQEDDVMSFADYVRKVLPHMKNLENEDNLKAVFGLFTHQGDNDIDAKEIRNIMVNAGADVTMEDCQIIFNDINVYHKQYVTYADFRNYFLSPTQPVKGVELDENEIK